MRIPIRRLFLTTTSRSNWKLKCWLLQREENRRTLRKTLEAWTRTNNKINPCVTQSPGIEPRPQWWEARALTIAPSRLSYIIPEKSSKILSGISQTKALKFSQKCLKFSKNSLKFPKILINFVSYSEITRNNELLIVKHHLLSLFKSCKNIN